MKFDKSKLVDFLLLISLLVIRLLIRANNSLWLDEIEQVSNLKSVEYLIFQYLPSIPGGSPGHYLITLGLSLISSGNKMILFLPGLFSHIFVFLLIPKIIKRMQVLSAKNVKTASLIARLGLVFDPNLIFQSVEIRPYSVLTLVWTVLFFISFGIFSKKGTGQEKIKTLKSVFLYAILLAFLFNWHFYAVIMYLSICLFFLLTHNNKPEAKYRMKIFSFSFIIAFLISLPFWIHFSRSSYNFGYSPFEHLINVFKGMFYKNEISSLSLLFRFSYLIYFLLFIIFLLSFWFINSKRHSIQEDKKVFLSSLKFFISCLFLPILSIVFLDWWQNYWFLFRQIIWVMLPFYLLLAIVSASIINTFVVKIFRRTK